jgi:hypothetical protein
MSASAHSTIAFTISQRRSDKLFHTARYSSACVRDRSEVREVDVGEPAGFRSPVCGNFRDQWSFRSIQVGVWTVLGALKG